MAVSFIGKENRSFPNKLRPVSDKIYHIKMYQVHLAMCGIGTYSVFRKMINVSLNVLYVGIYNPIW
jgi:hypothetical protein